MTIDKNTFNTQNYLLILIDSLHIYGSQKIFEDRICKSDCEAGLFGSPRVRSAVGAVSLHAAFASPNEPGCSPADEPTNVLTSAALASEADNDAAVVQMGRGLDGSLVR